MPSTISTLAIGSEILDGRVLDTNSNRIANQLAERGLRLEHSLTCDDKQDCIISSLEWLARHSSFVIVTGGLGPTSDDITRQAMATFAGSQLRRNDEDLKRLKDIYQRRNRPFDEINARQAWFPAGAKIIDNPAGMAAGFMFKTAADVHVACLPGVPREVDAMLPAVLSLIEEKFHHKQKLSRMTFRIFGLPESAIGMRVEKLSLPENISVSYRAHFPTVDLLLKSSEPALLSEKLSASIREAIDQQFVFSEELDRALPEVTHDLLCESRLTLSLAESCTAGLLGKLMSDRAGASKFLLGGAITYSNQLKSKLLGIDPALIEREGAVSHAVAAAMAKGARERFDSDLALSITGIAGPDGGSETKPVGTFYVGLADKNGATSFHYHAPFTRDHIRMYAAFSAIDTLRRKLLGLPFRE